jgi:hypothetical protein
MWQSENLFQSRKNVDLLIEMDIKQGEFHLYTVQIVLSHSINITLFILYLSHTEREREREIVV